MNKKRVEFVVKHDCPMGKAGDIVWLKLGYARYLVNSNRGIIKQHSSSKINITGSLSTHEMIEKLKAIKQFTMKVKAIGVNLVRQYSRKNIIEIINKKLGFDISIFDVQMSTKDENIKKIGHYNITVNTQTESIVIPVNIVQ